jgi:uncharacterized protein
MKTSVFKFLFVLLSLFLQTIVFAQKTVIVNPQVPPRLVNDFANVLSAGEKDALENKLVAFDKASSNQVNIIIIDTLIDYDIADYATDIGRSWGVGREKKNNGVIVIVVLKNREVNISPGYGLEGALPDVLCKQIIDREIIPSFRYDLYFDELDRATTAIIGATDGTYTAEDNYYGNNSSWGRPWWLIPLVIICSLSTVLFIHFAVVKIWELITGKKYKYTYHSWDSGSSNSSSTNDTPVDSVSSSGSSGFGGYGGGSFGGGGASGKW